MTDRLAQMRTAAETCVKYNIPFALYSLPGSADMRFMASMPDADGLCRPRPVHKGDTFFIGAFAADESYTPHIYPDMDEFSPELTGLREAPAVDSVDELVYLVSTPRSAHIRAVRAVAARLRRRGGKVVLSRHKALFSPRALVDVAFDLILSAPAAFGYLCFTPEHGFWYGATPELLLDATSGADGGTDNCALHAETMALAGTRWDSSEPWDEKNLSEHAMVADYIASTLAGLGLTVNRGELSTLKAGAVEHLYTPISADCAGPAVSPEAIARALSPTPAVAGLPVDEAIADIDLAESHQRRCYAGMVGVASADRLRAYVNLRCAKASPALAPKAQGNSAGDSKPAPGWVHNVYAGGGILGESDPDTEWEELERKSLPIVSLLTGAIENPVGCTLLPSMTGALSTCSISIK